MQSKDLTPIRRGQLHNALNERDAWRRRCEKAREERGELRTKIKAVRGALRVNYTDPGKDSYVEPREVLRKLQRALQ